MEVHPFIGEKTDVDYGIKLRSTDSSFNFVNQLYKCKKIDCSKFSMILISPNPRLPSTDETIRCRGLNVRFEKSSVLAFAGNCILQF